MAVDSWDLFASPDDVCFLAVTVGRALADIRCIQVQLLHIRINQR